MMESEAFDARINVPAGMVVFGPPLSGKSTFVLKLLQNSDRLLTKKFDYIYWFYGQHNKTIEYLQNSNDMNIVPVQGLPENIDDYILPNKIGCHIYDDLMEETSTNQSLANLTSCKVQHQSVFWVLILQNLFHYGKERITFLRCCHYMVCFKSPLDKTAIRYLASRVFPKNQKAFMEIYEKATSKANGYLFIDGAQTTPEYARLRTDIFGIYQIVFSLR